MTPKAAKSWVLTAVGVSGIVAVISNIRRGKLSGYAGIVVGALIAAAILSLVADGAPEVAAGIAGIVLVGALIARGGDVAESIIRAV